jgi:peptide/nickel transport system substrate-binding protein
MVERAQRQAVLAAIARREWLLQMLALGAAGCGRSGDRAYARGNTLIAAVDGYENDRPLSMDEYAEYLVFLPLVTMDERGDRQPCLATDWTHSPDYLEWTYRLRPGVHWHDGRPVTVDDVKFTIDLHAGPYSPVYGLSGTECTVHDESTFTVRGNWNWARSYPQDTYISIHPKHLLKDLDYQRFYEWDFWLRPVGNGPYRYLRYQPATMVELEANPDYYKGKPRIERIVLKFTRGANLTELLSGNVDTIRTNNPMQLSAIANDTRFQTYWQLPNRGRTFWAIVWQNQHPFFRDPNVRRALSLAINRRELVQVLHLPSPLSLVDGVHTVRQVQLGEASEPPYDPAEARRLLDASGWPSRSGDGVRERDGREFRFTALTVPGLGLAASLYLQAQLRSLGVRVDLRPLEREVLRNQLRSGAFEAAVCPSRAAVTPGSNFQGNDLDLSWFMNGSPLGYQNPQLMRLLEALETTADPDVLDQTYQEMSEILHRDQPIAFLFRPATAHVVHRRVQGLGTWRPDPLRFSDDLWLVKER